MNTREKYAEMQEDGQYQYVEKVLSNAEARKNIPVFSGVLKYFPNALKEVAKCVRLVMTNIIQINHYIGI